MSHFTSNLPKHCSSEIIKVFQDNSDQCTRFIIDEAFKTVFNYITEHFVEVNSDILLYARERRNTNDKYMEPYSFNCSGSDSFIGSKSNIEEILHRVTNDQEITTKFFTQDKKNCLKIDKLNTYINDYQLKTNGVNDNRTPNGINESFRTRIKKLFDLFKEKSITFEFNHCIVYGRQFSKQRRKVALNNNSQDTSVIDQIFVIYFKSKQSKSLEYEKEIIVEILNSMFYLIDQLIIKRIYAFESKTKKEITNLLPLIFSKEISYANTITQINKLLTTNLTEYLKSYDAISTNESVVKPTFLRVGYEVDNPNDDDKIFTPKIRVFPETCTMNDSTLTLEQQFKFNQPTKVSLVKYFVYLMSKAKMGPNLTNSFNDLFTNGDVKAQESVYLESVGNNRRKIKNHAMNYWDVNTTSSEGKTLLQEYNMSIIGSDPDNNITSALLFAFRLGAKNINDKGEAATNTIYFIESSNKYLFRSELLQSVTNIMILLSSVLESLKFTRVSLNYTDLLRDSYFSQDKGEKINLDNNKNDYMFGQFAFDLMRINLADLETYFLTYQQVKNNLDSDTQKKYRSYIKKIIETLEIEGKKFADKEFTKELSSNHLKDLAPNEKKELVKKHRTYQTEKFKYIKSLVSDKSMQTKISDQINSKEFNTKDLNLSSDLIDFLKNCHSCIIWSAWIGALRTVLSKRFRNYKSIPEFSILSTGYSALEVLLVGKKTSNRNEGSEIKQVIKFSTKKKIQIEVDNYKDHVRYKVQEAARISSKDGYAYMCEGYGVFEYGCLLSDLVYFSTANKNNTLQSFCTPQSMDHKGSSQLDEVSIKKIINKLFSTNLTHWNSKRYNFKTAGSILKDIKSITRTNARKIEYNNLTNDKWINLFKTPSFKSSSGKNEYNKNCDALFKLAAKISRRNSSEEDVSHTDLFNFLELLSDDTFPHQYLKQAIVHGDLSAHNIMLTGDEGSPPERASLIDFEYVQMSFHGADHVKLITSMLSDLDSFKHILKNVPSTLSITIKTSLESSLYISTFLRSSFGVTDNPSAPDIKYREYVEKDEFKTSIGSQRNPNSLNTSLKNLNKKIINKADREYFVQKVKDTYDEESTKIGDAITNITNEFKAENNLDRRYQIIRFTLENLTKNIIQNNADDVTANMKCWGNIFLLEAISQMNFAIQNLERSITDPSWIKLSNIIKELKRKIHIENNAFINIDNNITPEEISLFLSMSHVATMIAFIKNE